VRAAGRHITVTLPEDVQDIDGYEPVTPETKTALAGRTMDFPPGLTVDELEAEVSTRLKEKFEVGHIDLDLAADGSVTYLAVARRPVGIGHTLPPGEAAVALRADPPFSATAGDTVQIWRRTESGAEKLGTAELRASVGDVVTVSGAPDLANAIDPEAEYRLVTLPSGHRPDREFAAMLGRREETMRILSLSEESPLLGSSVAALAVSTLAIRGQDGTVEPIPGRDRLLEAGDVLYVVGRPEPLRKLEATAGVAQVSDRDLDSVTRPVQPPGERSA
jgi:uncharacterized protein with PhoU and TrkA domain